MIPKNIHYCWFGGKKLPDLANKCINSWKKYLPDYEIIEWNESNFDVESCDYVKEAYKSKKWAFVSDYARFKILYDNGGVYFDTDVELIKPIDFIIEKGAFMGRQLGTQVAPGLGMAMEKQNLFCKDMLDMYNTIHFENYSNTSKLKTIVDYTTDYFCNKGYQDANTIQIIDGIQIYPKEYFNPCDMKTNRIHVTEKTVSIHHYAGTWVDPYSKFRGQVDFMVRNMFGERISNVLRYLFGRR